MCIRDSVYTHDSDTLGCAMELALFAPPQAAAGPVPVLTYLSGLTCTWENAITKAGLQAWAAEFGVIVVCPDTSPRGDDVPDAADEYDFGKGAGFYIDATEEPWSKNYRMYSYITDELPRVLAGEINDADFGRQGIFGHSMGGHGALTLFLKNPGAYAAVSAFAPICNPTKVPWGTKAFEGYLGSVDAGAAHDACELLKGYSGPPFSLLVDQGAADNFLTGDTNQLQPEALKAACAKYTNVTPGRWTKVAAEVGGGKTGDACKKKSKEVK